MLPYRRYDRFILEDLDESQCYVQFRFKKEGVYNPAVALRPLKCLDHRNILSLYLLSSSAMCLSQFYIYFFLFFSGYLFLQIFNHTAT